MKGCLHILTRIAAILLAITFIVTLPLSLVAFNIGRVAFSPEQMTTLLVETIDETGGLRRLVIESLTADSASDEGGLDISEAMAFLTPQERDYLGEQLAPPGWAKAQLGSLVTGLYDWIDNDRDRPSFVVDITELKVALLAGGAADLVETVVDSWPPCSVEEIAEMSVAALLGEQSLRFCEPPEPLRSGLMGLINAGIALSLRALPDEISLNQADTAPARPELMETKERIRLIRFLAGWSWVLSPVMLGLVMALVIRSWRGLALWWGIPLLVGAVLTLVTIVGVRVGAEGVAKSAFGEAAMPAWMAAMIQAMITAMMAVVFRRVAFQAAILLLAGGLVLAGGLLLQRAALRRPAAGAAAPQAAPHSSGASTIRLAPTQGTPPEAAEPGEPPRGMFG
jgi:hypothetical protein